MCKSATKTMVSGFVNSCNLTEAVLEICEWYIIVATCDA